MVPPSLLATTRVCSPVSMMRLSRFIHHHTAVLKDFRCCAATTRSCSDEVHPRLQGLAFR